MNLRTAAALLTCASLCACASRSAPAPEPSSAPAVEPDSVVAEPAAEPAAEAPAAQVVDPDPPITRAFSPDALMVGVCRMGVRFTPEHDPEGPVVFRDEGAEPFVVDEPLWVVTPAGGLGRARVKHPFQHCPMGDESDWTVEERAAVLERRGWTTSRCWPAAELMTAEPLPCSVAPPNSPQFKDTLVSSLDLSHLLALPRDMKPPGVVAITSSVGLYNAVCQDEHKDYDEPGAMIPLSDPPSEVSRYARSAFSLGERWAHRIMSHELDGRDARLHLIHAADKQAKRGSKTPRRDLMLVERAGAYHQVWPSARQRHRGAGGHMRDHFCELPYWAPLLNVAIAPEDDGGALLLLISENDGGQTGLWALDLQQRSLTQRRAFTVEHELEYF